MNKNHAKKLWATYSFGVISFCVSLMPPTIELGDIDVQMALAQNNGASGNSRTTATVPFSTKYNVESYSGSVVQLEQVFARSIDYRFAIIRGLPKNFTLSAGLRAGKVWLLSKQDIENLRVLIAEGYKGNLELLIHLFREAGKAPTGLIKVTIRVRDPKTEVPPSNTGVAVGQDLLTNKDSITEATGWSGPVLAPGDEETLMQKADQLFRNGDISGARLLYERLAGMGSGKGALYMAQSFDPKFLEKLPGKNLFKPNLVKAVEWYNIAKKLGNAEADRRLNTISVMK